MLKKILMFALMLNTPYIMTSDFSTNPSDAAHAAVFCTVAGAICTWLAYKDFKKEWQALKEFDRHLNILKEMGVAVNKVSKTEFEWDSLVTYYSYTMDLPSQFSQQQEKKAKKHFNLLLASAKAVNTMRVWPKVGSLLLIPTAIYAFYETFSDPMGSN